MCVLVPEETIGGPQISWSCEMEQMSLLRQAMQCGSGNLTWFSAGSSISLSTREMLLLTSLLI